MQGRRRSDKAARILGDLELPALRAKYRSLNSMFREPVPIALLYFYTDPLEFADTRAAQEQQQIEARALNKRPGVIVRFAELAAVGIWPRVVACGESGSSHLAVFVRFSERGRRTLEASGLALSEVLRTVRRSLWVGYYVVGIGVIAVAFADRIARTSLWQVVAGIALLAGFVILIRRFVR